MNIVLILKKGRDRNMENKYPVKLTVNMKEFKKKFQQNGPFAMEHGGDRLWKIILVDDYNQSITLGMVAEESYHVA